MEREIVPLVADSENYKGPVAEPLRLGEVERQVEDLKGKVG